MVYIVKLNVDQFFNSFGIRLTLCQYTSILGDIFICPTPYVYPSIKWVAPDTWFLCDVLILIEIMNPSLLKGFNSQ